MRRTCLLVNNAGVMLASTFIGAPTLDAARREMETNYFGTLQMCRAFAPVLASHGGGAVVNMPSVTSFYTNPINGSYGASKAAGRSMTNGIPLSWRIRALSSWPCMRASSTPHGGGGRRAEDLSGIGGSAGV